MCLSNIINFDCNHHYALSFRDNNNKGLIQHISPHEDELNELCKSDAVQQKRASQSAIQTHLPSDCC